MMVGRLVSPHLRLQIVHIGPIPILTVTLVGPLPRDLRREGRREDIDCRIGLEVVDRLVIEIEGRRGASDRMRIREGKEHQFVGEFPALAGPCAAEERFPPRRFPESDCAAERDDAAAASGERFQGFAVHGGQGLKRPAVKKEHIGVGQRGVIQLRRGFHLDAGTIEKCPAAFAAFR